MPKIVYRQHLLRRLKERQFPQDYPRRIYKEAKTYYLDKATGHLIAIAKLEYGGKLRNLAIVFDKIGGIIEIITIYPITDEEIKNRVTTKRWTKI